MSKHNKKSYKVCWPSFNKQPIPDEMWVTLSFTDRLDATSSTGAYSYLYASNDIYDPNVTGVGTQPLAYDQWCTLYNRWVVLASEIEVICTSRAVSNQLSVAVVPITASSLTPSGYDPASQMRYAKIAATTGGGPSPKITSKVRMNELYGVPLQTVQSDDAFAGSTSASPNRRMLWGIYTETSGASDVFSLAIKIRYKVRFFQPYLSDVSLSQRIKARAKARSAAFDSLPVFGDTVESLLSDGVVIPARMEEALERSSPEVPTTPGAPPSVDPMDRVSRLERLVAQLMLRHDID